MKHIHLKKKKFCFLLLIFCAANTSFAIHPHVLDSTKVYSHDSSQIFMAHESVTKEQKVLKAQVIKVAKVLNRSERYAKKIAQKSYKEQRPGNGKQPGWVIFWIILGIGAVLASVYLFWTALIVKIVGGSGAGLALLGAIASVIVAITSFVVLVRKKKQRIDISELP
ncbi:MAG: hypothetical protein H7Y41_00350 [Hyphomonadaceae bacterium]|nr:hypothetical protein [Clostridia bacterium]